MSSTIIDNVRREKYTYKTSDLAQFVYNTGNDVNSVGHANKYFDSRVPVDKIRITVSDDLSMAAFTPGILIWTDLVNNFIGTCGCNYLVQSGGRSLFGSPLQPSNGVEYFFPQKILIAGNYNFQFTTFTNTIPATTTRQSIYVLVEYFVSEP